MKPELIGLTMDVDGNLECALESCQRMVKMLNEWFNEGMVPEYVDRVYSECLLGSLANAEQMVKDIVHPVVLEVK